MARITMMQVQLDRNGGRHSEQGERLSILMISPHYYPYLGGLERQAHMLARSLVKLGCQVTVLTGRSTRAMARHEWLDGVEVWRLPTHTTSAWRRAVTFLPVLPVILSHLIGRHDIVHAHTISWYLTGCLPISLLWRKPFVIKFPNVREFGIPGLLRRWFGNTLLTMARQADAWVALSTESQQELVAAGFAPQRIFLTSNGVDVSTFGPISANEKGELRRRLGLPILKPLVIFTGRLSPQKGIVDLLYVWSRIQGSAWIRPELLLCGDGPQRSHLEDMVHRHRIANVHFTGAVPNLSQFYQAADIFVLPSYAEGNSNAMLEAMASGLPVVSTNVGGSPHLLGRLCQQWLVEPGDRSGLADRLTQLLNNRNLRETVGEELLERVREHYAIDRVAMRYLAFYRMLVAGQGKRVAELGGDSGVRNSGNRSRTDQRGSTVCHSSNDSSDEVSNTPKCQDRRVILAENYV